MLEQLLAEYIENNKFWEAVPVDSWTFEYELHDHPLASNLQMLLSMKKYDGAVVEEKFNFTQKRTKVILKNSANVTRFEISL